METTQCEGCGTWIPFYEEECPFCDFYDEKEDEDFFEE